MKLRKVAIHFLLLLLAAVISGCASSMPTSHLIAKGDLNDESMEILARPSEYTLKTIDVASGKAYTKRFLFFTLEGDKSGMSILGLKDKLEDIASYRAINSLNGDGFYKISTEENKINILGLYIERHVKVTGNVLKLKNLGPIDKTRADKMRKDEQFKGLHPDINYEMLNIEKLETVKN